jgi:tRNA threonylcarbamoyl adenosine modification protein (Sua5/YciO/YrdC/YwlC family)
MTKSIALVDLAVSPHYHAALEEALAPVRARLVISPDASPRDTLKWVMQLSADKVAVCLLLDNEGTAAASALTALDPSIAALVWAPECADPARLVLLLGQSPALLSFTKDAQTIAKHLLRHGTEMGAKNQPSEDTADVPEALVQESDADTHAAALAPSLDPDIEHDRAALRELEMLMAAGKKAPVRKDAPVQIQPRALDFSLQLRELMSAGRDYAHSRHHAQVLGAHYLVKIGEPYAQALAGCGLDPGAAEDYLSGLDSADDPVDGLVVSDEVFNAVTHAKNRARAEGTDCVRVGDFLAGLLDVPAASIVDLLDTSGVSAEEVRNEIAGIHMENETCGAAFFKPSSMDQAGFYEFDETQVKEVANRLKDLPAFQKATGRVAEAKPKGAEQADGKELREKSPPVRTSVEPAPAPEKPELLRVRGEFPSVDIVEQTADLLLEGQLVAFPTDIMLALTADAANLSAVQNLRAAANVPTDKPLSILIHSTTQLKHLVRADLDALESLLDELWPRPLTLIFQAAAGIGKHLVANGKIAIRLPDDNLALGILSMLGRPLAVTSWDEDAAALTGQVAAIITADDPHESVQTTIVDLTQKPWVVLRNGATPPDAVLKFQK